MKVELPAAVNCPVLAGQLRRKRIYQDASPDDGCRVLVERLWPRGISKERARLDLWLKDVAPSPELRKWYGHEEARWPEFRRRYLAELHDRREAVAQLLDLLKTEDVTLIYASQSEQNSAAVLEEFLKGAT